MNLFLCDLDNTIMHSYKHRRADDVCMEWIKDKMQGFMSKNTIELFNKMVASNICFVPVTTRSIHQYYRIELPNNYIPSYAITTNGAFLFHNAEIDKSWATSFESDADRYKEELMELHRITSTDGRYIRSRLVDDRYLFIYCKNASEIDTCVQEYRESHPNLSIVSSNKKIYFFPPSINKGTAAETLKARLNPQLVISAGDSEIDIPMLNEADIVIVPNDFMASKIAHNKQIYVCNMRERFSEYVLNTVNLIIQN